MTVRGRSGSLPLPASLPIGFAQKDRSAQKPALHRKIVLHKNPRICTKTTLKSRVIANYFRTRDKFEPGSRDELLDRLRCGAATILDLSSLSKIRVSGVSWVSAARTYPLQPARSWLLLSRPSWPRLPLQSTYRRRNICRCYARTALVPGRPALPRPARHC